MTDHRLGLTLYKLEQNLKGEFLDEIINALQANENAIKMSTIE